MAQGQAKSVYRLTLKTVAKHLPGGKPYIASLFRRPADQQQQQQQERLQLASDYCLLVKNIANHKELLKTYNIGLDDDERTKKMVEAVARRVGFSLPSAQQQESRAQAPARKPS